MPPAKKRHRGTLPTPISIGNSGSPPTVASLALAFATWIPFSLSKLAEALGHVDAPSTYEGYARTFAAVTMSTAFSGIAAPETAMLNIAEWFAFTLAIESLAQFNLRASYAIELDPHCRSELLSSRHPPSCLFVDMCGFINATVKRKLDLHMHKLSRSALLEYVRGPQF